MTTPLEAIQKYLSEVKAVREACDPAPWHIGHVNEANESCDIDSFEGSAVAEVYSRNNQPFIAQSPVTQEKLERALAIAVSNLVCVMGVFESIYMERWVVKPSDIENVNKALADIARAIGEG